MRPTILLLFFLFLTIESNCQYQIGLIPRVSPDKGVYQKIGYTEVDIKYGSPSVNGRQIWGNQVPYDKVWRAGANNATTITFSTDVIINGNKLDSGRYTFFVVPRANNKWTAIFSSTTKQWGAFKYDKTKDALRVDILPKQRQINKEELSYKINQYGFQFGGIVLSWANVDLEIEVNTDYLHLFKTNVETKASSAPIDASWVAYLQGAEHLVDINQDLETAELWIKKSEELLLKVNSWNEYYYPKPYVEGHLMWTKAMVKSRLGDFDEALKSVKKLKNMENITFYNKENEEIGIDLKIEEWKRE